jgi:tetratricopeptide (TPR) repeat protein
LTITGRERRSKIGWSLLAGILLVGPLAGCGNSPPLDPRLSYGADALKNDETELARKDFENVAKETHDDPAILQEIGTVYLQEQRWEDAAEWLAKSENRAPTGDKVALLGLAYQSAGPTDRGCKDLSEAANKNQNDGPLLNLYGYQCLTERKTDLNVAIAMLERAATLTHHAGYVVDSVGWAYYRRFETARNPEDLKEAIRRLERAAVLVPIPDVREHLIQAYVASESPVALQPSLQYHWAIEDSMGAASTQLALNSPRSPLTPERMRGAIDLLEDATAKEPSDASLRLHLGEAYLAISDRDRAYVEFQKALWLDPQLKDAAMLLNHVRPLQAPEPKPEADSSPVTL